ncbi:EamA domain-containing membrane protein RarD [Aliiruegeria haliotis]|uniref:EamA domain-containing membrane protein RarD n=1 Tax=Aliiruegeria haliotis TaxID=1280846 RepID=A0A2T0RYM7_9RHOB|nr:DMT family transporter [Aliiruegeria haliotis]PRY26285.1 EamA domain-containing membrane protein RarD [Aliiruegeria haliotis]
MTATLRTAAWMMAAVGSFSTMAVAGRAVSLEHDTFEILLYRSIFSFLLVLTIGGMAGSLRQVNTQNLGLHLLRNLFHFTGQNLWFYALALIPLAQVIALEFTTPIWVALMAPLVLGERLTPMRMMAILLGFVGVLIIVRPELGGISPPMLAALASAIGFAGTAIATRKLTRTASTTCILFWLTLMQAVMGLICAGADGDVTLPSARAVPWLAIIGASGLSAHFCLTKALSLSPAGVVMPMDFLRLPVLALVGLLLYDEPLDLLVILGAGIILFANWMNLRGGGRVFLKKTT